jgi:bacterial/archaeal transporter family-2 protein
MNNFVFVMVLLLGSAAVLQAGLNRHILEHWGILATVLLNSLVFISVSVFLYAVYFLFPALFPDSFKLSSAFTQFKWWYVLPGLFGFFLVMGLPIAISMIGATKTFIYLIIAQMLSSLIWDMFQESIPLTSARVIAVLFAVASIVLINWGK